ncbi:hypothetical protein [Vreelandella profundi]|uniref:hypothetical protein n=1 Tax=Vreelandella profundi TaxID=2852117 RepID=UPI001F463F08|nr:hypothetical protein [Halomonas profundi]
MENLKTLEPPFKGRVRTAAEMKGEPGTSIALRSSETAIQQSVDGGEWQDLLNVAEPEGAVKKTFDIWIKDKEREAFEAATGGTCTIERTAGGQACHMFILPKLRWQDLVPGGQLGEGTHEAFIINGVEKSELLIGMYQSATLGSELVSQPGLVPKRSINWGDSRAQLQSAGFDMMGNWEWSAIAFWCMANGYQPHGNTDNGKSHSHRFEQGVNVEYDNVRTGSGPNTWRHNSAANGIADLVGNLWEWQWGFKMVDGRIFLASDNDKSTPETAWTDTGWDMSSTGNFASSFDAENVAPIDVRRALIMPNGIADPGGTLYTALDGERLPYRGGYRNSGSDAGLGALYLYYVRTGSYTSVGVRPTRLV